MKQFLRSYAKYAGAFSVLVLTLSLLPLGGGSWAASDRRQGPDLVVVEMFTSQSCNSCPPADQFLGELAKRRDVLALSMHVDYWNALGWRDPWSSAEVTERQRRYSHALGTRYVSTPQAIVQGESYTVGSDRSALMRLIENARRKAQARIVPIVTMPGPDRLMVKLPRRNLTVPATLWFVSFDDHHTAHITGGENAGASITYTNVVRSLRPIGTWKGDERSFDVDVSKDRAAGFGNCAVLVQARGNGPILGAVSLPMSHRGH